MAPTLFHLATQGPWEPSPWDLSCPHLSLGCPAHLSGAWDAFTTSHHPILGLPTTQRFCQGLPTPGHLPSGLPWEARNNQRPLPSSSGFIGPPAVGTRECLGRGDNVGSETYGETRNGQDSQPHSYPHPHGLLGERRSQRWFGAGSVHLSTLTFGAR